MVSTPATVDAASVAAPLKESHTRVLRPGGYKKGSEPVVEDSLSGPYGHSTFPFSGTFTNYTEFCISFLSI